MSTPFAAQVALHLPVMADLVTVAADGGGRISPR
jgi:hypothetical protein